MLVYFDESYNKDYMLYGALFNPHSKQLHKALTDVKDKYGFKNADGTYKELKYSTVTTKRRLKVAKDAVDAFMKSTSYFRAVVIELKDFDYSGFGKLYEPLSIKKARAYKRFAQLLLESNTRNIKDGVLLCDNLTRCRGDLFIEKMKELFCPVTFRDIREIDSSRHETQVNQINDILLGSILNEISGSKHKFKSKLRQHLVTSVGIPSLSIDYWKKLKHPRADELHPKYQVWVFVPGLKKIALEM
jgi:hypothetical protein